MTERRLQRSGGIPVLSRVTHMLVLPLARSELIFTFSQRLV